MKKLLLPMMLALCLPFAASAQDDTREMYTVFTEADSTLTFYYDDQKGTREGVTYEMLLNTNFQDWNDQAQGIARAVIDESFVDARPTSTAAWFASGYWDDELGLMSNLKEIEGLHRLNTSSVTSMVCMFQDCSALTSLDMSHFDTSKVTDMGVMFSGCSSLTSLDLSHFDTSNVRSMGSMFSGCISLTSLDLSHFDTGNVTKMDNMFRSCGLTSLDLSHFDTHNVTDMTCMFWGCSSLRSLDVSSFNTSRVYSMSDEYTGGMFSYCSSLTSLDLSSFDTKNVDDMYLMFYQCNSLKSLDLSNFDTRNVTYMSYMLAGCSSLVYVDIRGFNLQSIVSAHSMFRDSPSLRYIRCEDDWNASYPGLKSNNMFAGCVSLEGGAGTSYDESVVDATYARPDTPEAPGYFTSEVPLSYAVYTSGNKTLTFYYDTKRGEREGTVYGMTYDEQGYPEWNACKADVQKVVFDSSFAEARPESTSEWFSNCRNLLQIEGIENLNTENVTNMTGMFSGCANLVYLDVAGFNTTQVTDMTGMFSGCNKVKVLDVSGFDTQNVKRFILMFAGCESLESLDVSHFNTSNAKKMAWMFQSCKGLTSLDVSNFDTHSLEDDGTWPDGLQCMFQLCKNLTSIDLSNFDTSNVTNMSSMFNNCSSLKSLDLTNFNTSNAKYMPYMFDGCTSLASLDFSSFDFSNIEDRSGMFTSVPSDCVLYLPQGMTVSDFEGYEQGDLVHDAETNIVETNEDGTATCEELVMADDDYFMVRTPFEAKKAVFRFHLNNEEQPAGMPRRINEQVPDGHRVPIYIPFAFDSKQFGQVYQMGMLTDDKTAVQFDELQEPTTEANRPYIINSNGDDIVAENVMVEASERMEATGADEMLGVIEQTLVPMGGYWFDAANDKLLLAGEDEEVSVLAGRGYFLLPSAVGAASLDALFGPQIATGVASTPNSHQPTLIYDLQGRRLSPADAHSAKPCIAIVRMSDGTTRKTVRR